MTATLTPTPRRTVPATDRGPTRPSRGRVLGIDLARGFALLGMFTQHVTLDEASTGWVGWFFNEFQGRAAVLFFLLSGVSLSLIARRGSASAQPGVLRKRGVVLVLAGLLLTATIWQGSILEYYGIMFLAAPWLIRRSRRGLMTVAAAGLVAGPVALLAQQAFIGTINLPASATVASWLVSTVWGFFFTGLYPLVVWFGFFALGMLIGRFDLTDRRMATRLAVAGVTATLLVGGAANVLAGHYGEVSAAGPAVGGAVESASPSSDATPASSGSASDDAWSGSGWSSDSGSEDSLDAMKSFAAPRIDPTNDFNARLLYDVTGHSGRMGWTLQTSGIATAILGFALLLPAAAQRLLRPISIMGAMSLTAYLFHIALVNDAFGIITRGRGWTVGAQEWVVLALMGVMVGFCGLMHRLLGVGPAEKLLGSLTKNGASR